MRLWLRTQSPPFDLGSWYWRKNCRPTSARKTKFTSWLSTNIASICASSTNAISYGVTVAVYTSDSTMSASQRWTNGECSGSIVRLRGGVYAAALTT